MYVIIRCYPQLVSVFYPFLSLPEFTFLKMVRRMPRTRDRSSGCKSPLNISIASWNINGLKNKERDKGDDLEVSSQISQHDIVCLSETHTGGDYNMQIKDFYIEKIKTRPVCKKNNRYYGGMILLVRED